MSSEFSLSAKELACFSDTDFLLTKSVIQKKTDCLLSATRRSLKEYIQNTAPAFPETVLVRSGKISRGENYRNLPYSVLDFPRKLSQDDIFNLRTMIWWGHEHSITWHLSGCSLQNSLQLLGSQLTLLKEWNWWVCIGEDPWQYHRHPQYYQPAATFKEEGWPDWLKERAFCKFTAFLPPSHWNSIPGEAVKFLGRVVTLLDL